MSDKATSEANHLINQTTYAMNLLLIGAMQELKTKCSNELEYQSKTTELFLVLLSELRDWEIPGTDFTFEHPHPSDPEPMIEPII